MYVLGRIFLNSCRDDVLNNVLNNTSTNRTPYNLRIFSFNILLVKQFFHINRYYPINFYRPLKNSWIFANKRLVIIRLLQGGKMILVPPKCKIIFGAISNYSFFNIAIAILDFSLLSSYSYRSSNFAMAKVA